MIDISCKMAEMDYSKYIKTKKTKSGRFEVVTQTALPVDAKGKIQKGGPDDLTYLLFPDFPVWRGHSDIYLDGQLVLQLRGMRKFDGTSIVDEDEMADLQVEQKSILPVQTLQQWHNNGSLEVSYREKVNGKFAIFALYQLGSVIYLIGGSKNVHVVVELDKPIIGEDLHMQILRQIQKDLHKLSNEVISLMLNHTYVGEYVDGQHIVYVAEPYMVYFNCKYLPEPATILNSTSDLPTNAMLQQIRNMENIEGVVIEYLNINTMTMYRQKHKTIWYILWRCFREVLGKFDRTKHRPNEILTKLISRLHERNKQFLHLTIDVLSDWEKRYTDFFDWFQKSKYEYHDVHPFSSVGLARILHEFESGVVYNIERQITVESDKSDVSVKTAADVAMDLVQSCLYEPAYFTAIVAGASFGLPICVIMSGPSGSGKSTVAKQLQERCKAVGATAEIFSTDNKFIKILDGKEVYDFDFKKLGINHAANFKDFCESKAQVRIVDNTNLARGDFSGYLNYATNNLSSVNVILCCKPQTAEVLASRNIHGLTADMLKAKVQKYKILHPSYLGWFPIKELVAGKFPSIIYAQKTPLHVTDVFLGGTKPPDELVNQLGLIGNLNIVGISASKAGVALVVDKVGIIKGNHITCATNEKYKPVDVGTNISDETTAKIDTVKILAIYMPYF